MVEATGGAVELVKVNVDENPRVAQSFQVQSIPAVFAISERKVVDRFVGALPEPAVREFVNRLVPAPSEAEELIARGDEASLRRALELEPEPPRRRRRPGRDPRRAAASPRKPSACSQRSPTPSRRRRVAALARLAVAGAPPAQGAANGAGAAVLEPRLDALLDRAKSDDEARQELLDLLETMDPSDPRREQYRRALASRLF